MKSAFTCLFVLLSFIQLKGQNQNPNYDSTLAMSLGGDNYGMKMYVMVILKTGTNTSESKAKIDSIFAGHMKNIGRLVDEKKLIVTGPFGKNENGYRGFFILNVHKVAEAKQLLQTDPAISANLLFPEMYPWYGSAALPEYLKAADKIWKVNH